MRFTNYIRDSKCYESNDYSRGSAIDKLGELEDFIEEVDNATIIYKDGIATFHIDMVLDSETLEIVKKNFNCKEIKR